MTCCALAFVGALVGYLTVSPEPEHFATSVFSFEIPPGWTCHREVTETICKIGAPPSDAIVIMAMKSRNKEDTLAAYEAHLRGPLPRADGRGDAHLISLRRISLGGMHWIEGRYEGSEVPNWETTYLAANTAEVGILITFSVHTNFRAQRAADLEKMARTIMVNQRGL